MKYRLTAGAGLVALAAAAVYALVITTDEPSGEPSPETSVSEVRVVAPPSPAEEELAKAIHADPAADEQPGDLILTGPAQAQPGSAVTFGGRWTAGPGESVSGQADLQRLDGNSWSTIASMEFADGAGEVDVPVQKSAIYRLAYGGSDEVDAAVSHELVVTAGRPLASRLIATAESDGEESVNVTAAWTTEGGVPIVGRLGLEQAEGQRWTDVSTAVTGEAGTAELELDAAETARFRFSYPGGSRFAPARSDVAVALGDDVQTIPVQLCDDDVDIDQLPAGVGCHYLPVTSGTFVAGHDYLDNAWWNSIPVGSFVKLTGELPGVYEVVDRVIAQGRGAALGSASNWTCDDECDVILQTCQGSNTGFTWLRKVPGPPST